MTIIKTIGSQIREIRKEKNKTLKDVSDAIDVSISFLSQLELNKTNATLETIKKISLYLGVHPSIFFTEIETDENYPFHFTDLSSGVKQPTFKPMHVIMRPGENLGNDFSHIGHEFIYVLEGELVVTSNGQRHTLHEQDSIMIDASFNHYWLNESSKNTKFIVVTTF